MSLPINISDGEGSGRSVKVTQKGQLVVGPLDFSEVRYNALAVINAAYNFATPIANKAGVITEIIASAGKDVGVNGALLEIYLADSPTSTVVAHSILTVQIPANSQLVLTGLNWMYEKGFWLNGKTDDNTIYLTLAGYYYDV